MPPPFFFCARSFFHLPHPHWSHVPPLCTLRCYTCEQAAEPLLRTFAHVGPRETFSLGTSLNCRKDPCAPDYAYFECEDGNELVSKCSQSFWTMTGIPKQIGRSGESRRDAPTETVVPYISNHSPLKKTCQLACSVTVTCTRSLSFCTVAHWSHVKSTSIKQGIWHFSELMEVWVLFNHQTLLVFLFLFLITFYNWLTNKFVWKILDMIRKL